MRLKKIKLAGFKSFVDPTSIPFPGEMTAIVGPNGCGKSNVIDAVRWVLGESSAKNLRGDAMTDVIFNGSSARKPVGQCSVELVFDNSSGRIGGEYAKYNELSVKRLVTRDAQSHYFLNGAKCRRRDVTDLFLGTGLGPRSYAIIEQGMISRLIESKPQELRVFIEEAAGISKYKERRRETENRIRHTQDNLERLEDVRGELGQQLEKLQRQAAAARRYKALKATERQLKADLAAIRWLKHSEQIEKLQHQIQLQQSELEALVARQRGDEAGILGYQQQAEERKAQLDDIQQQLFTISTAITRIEQNQLHSQQRSNQIGRELHELADRRSLLKASLEEANQALQLSLNRLEDMEPRLELLDASYVQAQENRDQAEAEQREFHARTRVYEQKYNELKQQAQTCHSQIQSTMSMQLRTAQRIAELEQEQGELAHGELELQLEKLSQDSELAQLTRQQAEENFSASKARVAEQRTALSEALLKHDEQKERVQTIRSQLHALEQLQKSQSQPQSELEGIRPLWQSLTVAPGWELAVEQVLAGLNEPMLAEKTLLTDLVANWKNLPQGHRIMALEGYSDQKRAGSLAALLDDTLVPAGFNHIHALDSAEEALVRLPRLADHESVVVKSGLWMGRGWVMSGQADREQGALQRAAHIQGLQEQLTVEQALLDELADEVEMCRQTLHGLEQQEEQHQSALQRASNQAEQLQNQLSLVEFQLNQSRGRADKIAQDLDNQRGLLVQEEQQLEIFSEQLEMLEAEILEHETDQADVATEREQLEQKIAHARRTVEQQTAERHQLELSIQQHSNQRDLYRQQVSRNETQLEEYRSRETALEQEKLELAQPLEQQREQLEELLLQREGAEEQRVMAQEALSDLHKLIQEAQQDQQGIQHQIQQRQTAIDSIKLEMEGYRVRANTVLEQLQETGQSLKPILEQLTDDADEKSWQAELDKTLAAIGRLGAVNLAAVEEYDIQAERKAHLDTQHEDLVTALETLQSAIRKIDKETRSRFSDTFERVNEDLKQLFPKVFGGGSAYLALTDDDLLETGVTIMARPPGKKNSTIHLLSGGEKALTALSLVFAIFRLNPAPFCLLDEVDAPLDDANVGRFCALVSEMSRTVQFIYITHNKIAMEMASHLTGVTMAEPGVSRMVAVDVEEAMAFAEP
ncbi:chromosome segregation protein SMC [Alteromonas aestuariivivens]|uniref:Chromosome partition protein Smc n=1 Tax=Alteromonas aestuariivivens TaxID=1938339 RepID=A0A3D8M8T9_9ALTE|nr:chromosome segregation protein SMC [Alteromonas aestuariivivens]RDV26098.1 chromosome segregation protein SMC [Alteromonas aestuariivivens]